jgi:hypothetical protein
MGQGQQCINQLGGNFSNLHEKRGDSEEVKSKVWLRVRSNQSLVIV